MDDVPPAGVEAAFSLVDLLRRHARRAPGATHRRPHLGAARRPRSTATGSPTTRSWGSSSSWSSPATRPPPSCSATPGTGRGATPTSGPSPSPTPAASPLGRGDAALRHVEPDAGPRHHRATSSCTAPTIPAGDRVLLLVGSANRDERVFDRRRPLRPRPPRARAAADRQLRLRPPLLPRRLAGPARGPRLPRGARRPRRRLRHRPDRHPPRPLASTSGASPPSPPRWWSADAAVRRRTPTAGRRSSPARRRASARRPRVALADGRPPGRARGPAARPPRGDGRRRSAPPAARRVALPLDLTDDASIDAFAERGRGRARADRDRRVERRRRAARPPRSTSTPTTSPARCRSTCSAPSASCHASARRWSSAGAATSSSSRPTSSRVPRPYMAAYVHVQERPRGPGPRHADGARGHRRARRHRAPRPVDHRAGHHLERGDRRRGRSPTGSAGASLRHRGALRGRGRRRAPSLAVVSTPRGTHLTLVEVEPEAPVGGTA